MIVQLTGKVIAKTANKLTIDVNGVGYSVDLTSSSMSAQPPIGQETSVSTHLHVKDDRWQLYGFSSTDEKVLFEKLISISGIGPRLAMNILSSHSIEDFKRAVTEEDIEFLSKVPRLGSKNAKRIILELKDKLTKDEKESNPVYTEAAQALKSLGYTDNEIKMALSFCPPASVYDDDTHWRAGNGEEKSEKLVKQALRYLANG